MLIIYWSSDLCSSDLSPVPRLRGVALHSALLCHRASFPESRTGGAVWIALVRAGRASLWELGADTWTHARSHRTRRGCVAAYLAGCLAGCRHPHRTPLRFGARWAYMHAGYGDCRGRPALDRKSAV